MPNRCVVWGCDSTPNPKEGVFLFTIPFFNDDRQEAKRRRRRWVNFVNTKRKNFFPSKGSSICSKHFLPDDLTVRFAFLPGQEKPLFARPKRDEFGVCVYPTLQDGVSCENEPVSDRKRRKILKHAMIEHTSLNNREEPEGRAGSSSSFSQTAAYTESKQQEVQEASCDAQEPESHVYEEAESGTQTNMPDPEEEPEQGNPGQVSTQKTKKSKKSCKSCARLRKDKKCWHERWKQQRKQLDKKNEQLQSVNERVSELENYIKVLQEEDISKQCNGTEEPVTVEIDEQLEEEEMEDDDFMYASDEDSLYLTETESEEEDPLAVDEADDPLQSLNIHGTDMRTEPKHIVFLSQLLMLFRFCHICKADCPLVEARQMGTEVVVTTLCKNPSCPQKEFVWHSQPYMKFHSGQKGPAGNFLLSMAVLFGGGSATKVFQIFAHMGLACISLRSFFNHQRNYLFPTIYLHWKNYQEKMLEKVKGLEDDLVVAGDARHDSMGHNAKYGCYTIFCCNLPRIIHFSLVQRNQAESSNAMEFVGFKNCMEYLLDTQRLPISTMISDRHTSISCHMKKVLTNIKHYFDLWHLKKKIRKVLTKLAKEKSCEAIKDWIKPCENHLYIILVCTLNKKWRW